MLRTVDAVGIIRGSWLEVFTFFVPSGGLAVAFWFIVWYGLRAAAGRAAGFSLFGTCSAMAQRQLEKGRGVSRAVLASLWECGELPDDAIETELQSLLHGGILVLEGYPSMAGSFYRIISALDFYPADIMKKFDLSEGAGSSSSVPNLASTPFYVER